ncbi:ArsR/SmtB family transcription factor [Methylobacterium oryzihabitans]|uniref:Transcriptional regulator n=1 Tax=Methylobacterium oryzihabitans TaxID=2499852 RepID=A0A3S2YU86_9HYPH|nr:helix-turn-helix transcriptional regulator [Methylobacterium oryzihabitans]RVU19359.1 transcriptional regulator [Methylobacterium oryzihabitans]
MTTTAAFAQIAALMGDPARAGMLDALLDGRALTAAELARAAGVTPQTASSHLARLSEAGLLAVERQGRHRYHRLASPSVARMMESVMAVAADRPPPRRPATGPRDRRLRHARTCYDHLAGHVAVAMADAMVARGQIDLAPDGGALTPEGAAFLRDLGIDLDRSAGGRRVFCRPCLDWSERRPHIAGVLGAALLDGFLARGWLRRLERTRAVEVTPPGRLALARAFGIRDGA